MTYGYFYANQFDVTNNEVEKDWQRLLLDRGRATRILGLLNKRTVLEEIVAKSTDKKYKIIRI